MSAMEDLLPWPPGVTGFSSGREAPLTFRSRSEARRVVSAMFTGAIEFDPVDERPAYRSFHDARATLGCGRDTERVRVLVHGTVPWIAFAADGPPESLANEFVPMPALASSPPEPFVVVPLSLLERPVEAEMLVRLGSCEPRTVWNGDRVGDLVFNYQDSPVRALLVVFIEKTLLRQPSGHPSDGAACAMYEE